MEVNDTELINCIKNIYLKPPSLSEYNLSKFPIYKKFATAMTWGFIHKKLQLLFENEPPGFFIEAGALDGEYLSNTLWLEKEKGWTGLLIEPDPINHAALLKKNRKVWSLKACILSVPYPQRTTFSFVNPSKQVKYVFLFMPKFKSGRFPRKRCRKIRKTKNWGGGGGS